LKERIFKGEEEGVVGDLDKEEKQGDTKRRWKVFLWRSCNDVSAIGESLPLWKGDGTQTIFILE